MGKPLNIALVGNPNSGKSSLFNLLTGLNQKVSNFPGVTVEMKMGQCRISDAVSANILDLPGTYSLYPKRADEWVTYSLLLDREAIVSDLIILVADASNLKRNLLFCSQIIDLGKPVIVALTMMDLAKKNGTQVDIPGLERELGVPVVAINPRKNKGISELKRIVTVTLSGPATPRRPFVEIDPGNRKAVGDLKKIFPRLTDYAAIHYLINKEYFSGEAGGNETIAGIAAKNNFNATKTQAEEIVRRYSRIKNIMTLHVIEADPLKQNLITERIDKLLLHRFWGYLILLSVLFLLFQSVFWIAAYPMDAIEQIFSFISGRLADILPAGRGTDLLINGVLAGLSGIFVFVPQIMILFGLITLLEDSGYMARISFLTDKMMRRAGLNGKSVMPMISGYACAVPAIMSARNIENSKERILTIMVTPLMSCSARLPVYTILISLVVPDRNYFGIISLQGMVMMMLYVFGTFIALNVAWIMKWFIKSAEKSYFILELPVYRAPRWHNVFYTMVSKARVFIFEAGKVIMIISILLWGLSTFGPPGKREALRTKYAKLKTENPHQLPEILKDERAALLETSFAGELGRKIEPVIAPLGFDWKIGIALITSFAAREVFVGTMATLYSVGEGSDENNSTLRQKMAAARRPDGSPVYTLATGMSLIIFYVLAMQCMSTLAIVRRETKSWKWPMIQLGYMTVLAYLMSLATFIILN